VTSNRGQK